MGPGVVADHMAVVGHLPQQVLVLDRHLAAHEEDRPDVVVAEDAQDVRGVAGVGAVVEAQHHAPAAPVDPQERLAPDGGRDKGATPDGLAVPGDGPQPVRGRLERRTRPRTARRGEGARCRTGGPVADEQSGGARRTGRAQQGGGAGQQVATREHLILRHD